MDKSKRPVWKIWKKENLSILRWKDKSAEKAKLDEMRNDSE